MLLVMPPPGFDELSPDDKLDYIQALWERFTARSEEVPVPGWHREVIAERLSTEGETRPWSAVREDLLAKLRNVRG